MLPHHSQPPLRFIASAIPFDPRQQGPSSVRPSPVSLCRNLHRQVLTPLSRPRTPFLQKLSLYEVVLQLTAPPLQGSIINLWPAPFPLCISLQVHTFLRKSSLFYQKYDSIQKSAQSKNSR